jgi:polysaccharide deacetylase family protein (PEP-CTERM system associated)
MSGTFLFGVDLEDIRLRAPGGRAKRSRVAETTDLYLDFLDRRGARGTFFAVGDLAREQPDLIRRIAAAGHEIACHSDAHVPLGRQDAAAFREDLRRNRDALGVDAVGYRAPAFSLTGETRWAYDVLAEEGFAYSSSVLPARNPISGWPGFGAAPRLISGIVELPMTLTPWRLLPVPIGGGVYFRAMPAFLLRRALARRSTVLGYFHPYDVDVEGEPHAFPDLPPGPMRWLMRYNRSAVLPRLQMAAGLGFAFAPYRGHAERVRAELMRG